MPVHDWTRVDAGTFHAFHNAWITHLMEALNDGLLPEGYYALAEQHTGGAIADVLTLQSPDRPAREDSGRHAGTLLLDEAPPRTARRMAADARSFYRLARRTLTIRHVSNHRIVALIEILSPGNKDRARTVEEFVDKVDAALKLSCHVLVVDLFSPGPHDPRGIHGAIWDVYASEPYELPAASPLTLASYMANGLPEAFVSHVAVGDPLPDMPVFLDVKEYIPVPLEATVQRAYRGLPAYWRDALEGGAPS